MITVCKWIQLNNVYSKYTDMKLRFKGTYISSETFLNFDTKIAFLERQRDIFINVIVIRMCFV